MDNLKMLKINLRLISIITAYLIFFWDMGFLIESFAIPIAPVLVIIVLLLFLLKYKQRFIKKVFLLYHKTPFKYMCWFVIWAIISPLIFGQLSNYSYILYRIFRAFFVFALPAILFPLCLSRKDIMKIISNIYLFILIYGIIQYFGEYFNICFLNTIHDIFCSCTASMVSIKNPFAALNVVTLYRAKSIFFEPSIFASVLFVFLPYVYLNITKISSKNNKNLYHGRLLLFLTWLNLILTKSPIYLIFSVLYTLFFFRKKIFNRYVISSVSIFLILLCFAIKNTAILESNYQLKRIFNFFGNANSLTTIIQNDQSLGTRIVSIVNTTIASKNVLIQGTGYGNAKNLMHEQYENSPLPLTIELTQKCFVLDVADGVPSNIFVSVLIHTGLIGLMLLYCYFLYSIVKVRKIRFYFKSRESLFIDSISLMSINYVIVSVYWSLMRDLSMWFIFGILNVFILSYNINKNRYKNVISHQE